VASPTQARVEELKAELARALVGIRRPLSAHGTFTPKESVAVKLGRTRIPVTRLDPREDPKKALAPLLARAKDAVFGHAGKTVKDAKVRKGKQLKADFTITGFDPKASGVLEQVSRVLCDGAEVRAELYDVNVYERGGHFAKHRDTPRGPDMLGTLVVCLPSSFSGGALVLRHAGKSITFDWGPAIGEQEDADTVHWAAFFGDVEHEVLPVVAGYRVTVTYKLVAKKGGDDDASIERRFADALSSALRDPRFLPAGGVLAFPCFHLYSGRIDAKSIHALKGRDMAVAASARTLRLEVDVHAYLSEREMGDAWELGAFPTPDDLREIRREIRRAEAQGVGEDGGGLTLDMLDSTLDLAQPEKGLVWVIAPPWSDPDVEVRVEAADEDDDEDDEEAPDEPESEEDEDEEELDEDEDDDDVDDDDAAEDEDVEEAEEPSRPALPPMTASEVAGDSRPAARHVLSAMFSTTGYFGNEAGDGDFYAYAALHVTVPPRGSGPRARGGAT
jgi:hypothetical protein